MVERQVAFLRADASGLIGVGHVMRLLVLFLLTRMENR